MLVYLHLNSEGGYMIYCLRCSPAEHRTTNRFENKPGGIVAGGASRSEIIRKGL
jgi:hypothetical protein